MPTGEVSAVDRWAAEAAAVVDAEPLAEAVSRFDGEGRVVGHSLGCKLLLEALPLLPPAKRPKEVHLCAAAATDATGGWTEETCGGPATGVS